MPQKSPATLRLDPATLDRLQELARLESVAQRRTVTWCDCVRRLIAAHLSSPNEPKSPAT